MGALGPRLLLPQPSIDFGRRTNELSASFQFVCSNVGDQDLIVSKLTPDCPLCLKGEVAFRLLKPGERGIVRVDLDFLGLAGPVAHSLTLESNDAVSHEATLNLEGVLVRTFEAEPAELHLRIRAGETNAMIRVRSFLPLQEPTLRAQTSTPVLHAAVKRSGSNEYLVSVELVGQAPEGTTRAAISLRPDNSTQSAWRIPCVLHSPPDIEVIPQVLRLPGPLDQEWETLWIRQHSFQPRALLQVTPTPTSLVYEVVPQPGSPHYRIRLKAVGPTDHWPTNAHVALRFGAPGGREETIYVPVHTRTRTATKP